MRRIALLLLPPLGAAIVAVAATHERIYGFLVREDSLLEWAQVVTYLVAVVTAVAAVPGRWRGGRGSVAVLIVLAAASAVAAGEEISWGQRLIGYDTPAVLAENRQGETTIHNDPHVEVRARAALVAAGVYGTIAPLVVRRRTSVVPPRDAVSFFAVAAAYFAFRLLFLEHPSYVEAKYSEWPELCFAAGVALWCIDVARGPRARPRPQG